MKKLLAKIGENTKMLGWLIFIILSLATYLAAFFAIFYLLYRIMKIIFNL